MEKRFGNPLRQGVCRPHYWRNNTGFRVGFNCTHQLSEVKYNLLSAEQNPQVVDEYLSEEIRKGQITEVKPENGPLTQASPIGVIHQRNTSQTSGV